MQGVRQLLRRHGGLAALVVIAVAIAVVAELALTHARLAPSEQAAQAHARTVAAGLAARLAAEPSPERRGCEALAAMTVADAAPLHDELRGVVQALGPSTDPPVVAMRNFIDLMSGGSTPALEAAAKATPSKEYGPYTAWGDISRDYCKTLGIAVS
jgi:hypothetical protein